MRFEGSCHCRRVRFTVESPHPYPYSRCYCSICRKTGGGGFAVNLGAEYDSLKVDGEEHLSVYRALIRDEDSGETRESEGRRHFCSHCGSALWVWDPRWPELVHPFATAIDSDLPEPPERVHLMLKYRANWVEVPETDRDRHFDEYPTESLADWHRRLGLEDGGG